MNQIFSIRSLPVEHEDLFALLDRFHRLTFDLLTIDIVVNTFVTVLMIEQVHRRYQR